MRWGSNVAHSWQNSSYKCHKNSNSFVKETVKHNSVQSGHSTSVKPIPTQYLTQVKTKKGKHWEMAKNIQYVVKGICHPFYNNYNEGPLTFLFTFLAVNGDIIHLVSFSCFIFFNGWHDPFNILFRSGFSKSGGCH